MKVHGSTKTYFFLPTDLGNSDTEKTLTNTPNVKEENSCPEKYDLWQELVDFVSTRVAFTIKRLLPADQKNLYTRRPLNNVEKKFMINPFVSDYPITNNEEKGGINVWENLVYGW